MGEQDVKGALLAGGFGTRLSGETAINLSQWSRLGTTYHVTHNEILCGARKEKGTNHGGFINGGFSICEPERFDLTDGDRAVFEREPMDRLIDRGQLAIHAHNDYWQSMDSRRDKAILDKRWATDAPWKIW